MSECKETVTHGSYEAEIDEYGGVVFHRDGERLAGFGPAFMRKVEAVRKQYDTGDPHPESVDGGEEQNPPGFEMSDFPYTANHGTTGLAPLDVLQRGYQRSDRDTAAALFSTDLLRETLEVAEAIGDADAMWVVVSQDAPMAFVPEEETLGAAIAPQVKPGNEPNPFEEEAETDD